MPSDVLTEALQSFTITGEDSPSESAEIPAPRRSSSDVVRKTSDGRSRFHHGMCKDHPFWPIDYDEKGNAIPFFDSVYATDDVPCAKFGDLPGRGRGVSQPTALRILISGILELARPLAMVALLVGSLYGLTHVIHGGGIHVLRSGSHVRPATGGVSGSSEHGKANSLRSNSGSATARPTGNPSSIHSDSVVTR